MLPSEIAWHPGVLASTYAELGEAWSRLKKASVQLAEPDCGFVIPLINAVSDYDQALYHVNYALRGLASFLDIQEAYLERVRKPDNEPFKVNPLTQVTFELNQNGQNSNGQGGYYDPLTGQPVPGPEDGNDRTRPDDDRQPANTGYQPTGATVPEPPADYPGSDFLSNNGPVLPLRPYAYPSGEDFPFTEGPDYWPVAGYNPAGSANAADFNGTLPVVPYHLRPSEAADWVQGVVYGRPGSPK